MKKNPAMSWSRAVDLYRNDSAPSSVTPLRNLLWIGLGPVLGLTLVLAALIPGSLVVQRLVSLDPHGDPVNAKGLIVLLLMPFSLMILAVTAWTRFGERRSLADIGVPSIHGPRNFFLGHGAGLLSALLVVAGIALAGGYSMPGRATAWRAPESLFAIAALLPAFALQSSAEELFFRGWFLSLLARKTNLAYGVLMSSMVFALLHFAPGQSGLVTVSNLGFGLFCAAATLRSGNAVWAMGWHSGWNWLVAVGFGVPITGLNVGIPPLLVGLDPVGPSWLHGGPQGPEGSAVCVALFALGTTAMLLSRRRTATCPEAGYEPPA
jgi:uncharacterized protein